MNCRTCRSKLALHAGGDLAPRDARDIEAHLARCPECRSELASYRRSREVVREYAGHEAITVPDDLAGEIMRTVSLRSRMSAERPGSLWYRAVFRYGLAACLLVSMGLQWHRISGDMTRYRLRWLDSQQLMVESLVSRDRSLVSAHRLASLPVSGPWRLDEWKPSGDAGIYVILHKPDPVNRPDMFTVDYLGEASRIDYRGDLWRRQRINRLTERTGSEENIYIAEYPMPDRTEGERRATLNSLIDSLHPYFN